MMTGVAKFRRRSRCVTLPGHSSEKVPHSKANRGATTSMSATGKFQTGSVFVHGRGPEAATRPGA